MIGEIRPATCTRFDILSKLKRAIGLMSGTSMDGIDVALVETDGKSKVVRGPAFTYPYSEAFRGRLAQAAADAARIRHRGDRPGVLHLAEQYLTDLHAEAVNHFLQDISAKPETIDVIGFHGHTVLHRPLNSGGPGKPRIVAPAPVGRMAPRVMTVQIGDGKRLARMTGIDVVYDMRAADVAGGGQGAPPVPVYHAALAAGVAGRPLAILNLGGVANVTWIGGGTAAGDVADGHDLLAFDTGPGNALIDDFMLARTGKARDENGAAAAVGKVHEEIVAEYLRHTFFHAMPPKSLDRNAFSLDPVAHLSTEDGAATLAAFTAGAVSAARGHFRAEPKLWIACGGGRKNRTLMQMLAGKIENALGPAEAAGLDGDAIEAEAWGYLAVRSLLGLPLTFPGATGVSVATPGGVLAKAKD